VTHIRTDGRTHSGYYITALFAGERGKKVVIFAVSLHKMIHGSQTVTSEKANIIFTFVISLDRMGLLLLTCKSALANHRSKFSNVLFRT
jgi:hypothetical protein